MAPSANFILLMTLFSLAMVSGITAARVGPPSEYKNLQSLVEIDVTEVVEAIDQLMQQEESTSLSGKNNIKNFYTNGNDQKSGKVQVFGSTDKAKLDGYPYNAETVKELGKDFYPAEPNPFAFPYGIN